MKKKITTIEKLESPKNKINYKPTSTSLAGEAPK